MKIFNEIKNNNWDAIILTHEAKAEELSRNIPALQEVVKATWRREDELKELKTELAALNRKIELSLKPVDEIEDKKEEKQEKQELTEEEKTVRDIQALFTGKISPGDITGRHDNNNGTPSFPVPERLKEYKESMGERLVIGTVPKYHNETHSKGFKL